MLDTSDLADFMLRHLDEENQTYDVGGTEVYSYNEMARLFFEAAGKEAQITHAPEWLFTLLAFMSKIQANGKEAVIRFSRWTLTHDLVAEHKYGQLSFKEYVKEHFQ